MIKRATRTLAIFAVTALVGCSTQLPSASSAPQTQTLRIYTSPAAVPLMETLRESYLNEQPHVRIETRRDSHAYLVNQLSSGEISHFISNHHPGSEQFHVLPLAQDALAIITHPDNPVQALSVEQIRRIYRGYVTNWQQLGGADLAIVLYSRESASGTRAEFERLLMGQQRTSPNAQVLPSNRAMQQQVAQTPGAIGYVPLSQLAPTVQALAIDGQAPTVTNIVTNRYPLRITYYLISASGEQDPYQEFANWVQGIEGQASLAGKFAPLP